MMRHPQKRRNYPKIHLQSDLKQNKKKKITQKFNKYKYNLQKLLINCSIRKYICTYNSLYFFFYFTIYIIYISIWCR